MEQQQQQQQYGNLNSVPGGYNSSLTIPQRIENSLSLIIRILAYIQGGLSLLIFAMEIGIIVCYNLFASATTSSGTVAQIAGPLTAAGIWTSIAMDIAICFLYRLVKQINERRMWMINAITQCILFLFSIILIGITGDYVNKRSGISGTCSSGLIDFNEPYKYLCTKYQLHQAQLAFAILIFFSAILFIVLFLYLYFVRRNFSSSVIPTVNLSDNSNNPVIQQFGTRYPAVSPNNLTSIPIRNDSVLKEIQCPHCRTRLPLSVPKGTHILPQQLNIVNSSY